MDTFCWFPEVPSLLNQHVKCDVSGYVWGYMHDHLNHYIRSPIVDKNGQLGNEKIMEVCVCWGGGGGELHTIGILTLCR